MTEATTAVEKVTDVLRPHAEQQFAAELAALRAVDDRPRPANWRLSPWAVVTYLLGGTPARPSSRRSTSAPAADRGRRRHPGHRSGTAAARRAGHRQNLGVANTWRRPSRIVDPADPGHRRDRGGGHPLRLELRPPAGRGPVDGGAGALADDDRHAHRRDRPGRGTHPHAVRRAGRADHRAVARRPCRCPNSASRCRPAKGFNVIATANDRDRGVNELSRALRRRFNTVVLPLPADRGERCDRGPPGRPTSAAAWNCRRPPPPPEEIRRVVTVFRELRSGVTADGRTKLKVAHAEPSRRPRRSRWSPAAWRWPHISVTAYCGPADVAGGIVGAVIKDPVADRMVWTEYLEAVVARARRAGRTSTAPAARSPDDAGGDRDGPGPGARDPAPRPRFRPRGADGAGRLAAGPRC